MNCLTNEEIQRCIDNELDSAQKEAYAAHIERCAKCREQYVSQKEFALMIKNELKKVPYHPMVIPPFRGKVVEDSFKLRKKSPIWLKVAAALVPVLIAASVVFNKPNNKHADKCYAPTHEEIAAYEMFNSGLDANTVYQKNMIVTTISDENGKTTKHIN